MGKLTAKERNMIARETARATEESDGSDSGPAPKTSIRSFVALILIFTGMVALAWVVFSLLVNLGRQ